MQIRFTPLSQDIAKAMRAGAPDAYGNPAEEAVSDGTGIPCRRCLRMVPEGQRYLIFAHRPFAGLNPYTETGPVFICKAPCMAEERGETLPEFLASEAYIVRGYDRDERIVYGTGAVTPTTSIVDRCRDLLGRDDVAFVHVRSASNNCFHVRADAGQAAASSQS